MTDLKDNITRALRQSEVRSRRAYAYDAAEYLERHSALLGLLSREIRIVERDMSPQNVIYFPLANDEVVAMWRDRFSQHFSVIGRSYEHVRNLVIQYRNWLVDRNSFYVEHEFDHLEEIIDASAPPFQLVKEMSEFLRVEAGSCLMTFRLEVRPSRLDTDPINKQLAGLLLLNSRHGDLPSGEMDLLHGRLQDEFLRYLESIRSIYQLDRDFLVSRLLNIGGAVEESASQGMIFGTRLLHHRFGRLRQVADSMSALFDSPEKVMKHPDQYRRLIHNLRIQMDAAKRLSRVLEILGEDPQITPCDVQEALDVYQGVFERAVDASELHELVKQEVLIEDPTVLTRRIVPPYRLLDEVLRIQIDNCLREVKKEVTENKLIELEIRDSRDYVYFDIKNFGPPIPPDVLEDIRRSRQVRNAQGSGLGVFLSTHIMSLVQGKVNWYSPIVQGKGTKVSLGFRKFRG